MKKLWIVGLCCGLFALVGNAAALKSLVISAPGPRNLSYLPIDLIPRIGVDREAGYELRILHTGGGAVALNNLLTRNADFAVAGVPAVMSLRANGGDVTLIAPVDDAPLFVLMVRAGLKKEVKRIADLKGHVIGVNTSTKKSKTTSQQLLELLLKSGHVGVDQVRIVPAGQSWVEQSSLLVSETADAVMGDEPFASRLLAQKQVYFLANLAEPKTVAGIPGVGFLHAALVTSSDLIRSNSAMVGDVVNMLRKTLDWMAHHSPEAIVAKLEITDPEERSALLYALQRYRNAYSADGRFSSIQLHETDVFYRSGSDAHGGSLHIESMTDDRWAGRKP